MDVNEIQEKIKAFNDVRGWSHPRQLKDLLLNISEEIGEFWNKIKWVDTDTQMKIINEHNAEVANDMADMLYLILKMSYMCNVNIQEAIEDVLDEYEKRFPVDEVKGKTGNLLAGGVDKKKEIEKELKEKLEKEGKSASDNEIRNKEQNKK